MFLYSWPLSPAIMRSSSRSCAACVSPALTQNAPQVGWNLSNSCPLSLCSLVCYRFWKHNSKVRDRTLCSRSFRSGGCNTNVHILTRVKFNFVVVWVFWVVWSIRRIRIKSLTNWTTLFLLIERLKPRNAWIMFCIEKFFSFINIPCLHFK